MGQEGVGLAVMSRAAPRALYPTPNAGTSKEPAFWQVDDVVSLEVLPGSLHS